MDRKFLIGSGVAAVAILALIYKMKSASAGAAAPLVAGSKILLVGDSLAVGLTARMKTLAEAAGYGFASQAIVGTRSDQWAPKMDALLAQETPGLVLISLGTNDATTNKPEAQAPYFASIAASVSAGGGRLIWIGMPTLPARIAGQDVVRAIVDGVGPEVIDSRAMSFYRASDEIHSSPQGYASWADQIWADLRNRGVVGA